MFFPNHQGMYDVLAILDACPYPFSVVAKKEVKDVPFLKQVFSCMHAYMIDREDIRQSMQVIIDVSKEVQNMEIRSAPSKAEALKLQPKQNVRLFRLH